MRRRMALILCGGVALVGIAAWISAPVHSAPLPKVAPEVQNDLIRGTNALTWELLRKTSGESGNVVLSPISITTSVGMSYVGARGQTAQEMAQTLGYPGEPSIVAPALHRLREQFLRAGNSSGQSLTIANSLWVQNGFDLHPDYVLMVQQHFGGELHRTNFGQDREKAALQINRWVDTQTRHHIPKLLDANDLDPLTRLVLTNAIYFKGSWEKPFDKRRTEPKAFELAAGKSTFRLLRRPVVTAPILTPVHKA